MEPGTRNGWGKGVAAFAAVFVIYQASEALQTVYARGSPIGPALMAAAALAACLLGRWLAGGPGRAYGLEVGRGPMAVLAGGIVLAGLARLAAMAAGLADGGYVPSPTPPPGLTAGAVALAALTTFIPSITEDILTRGFLLRVFPLRLGGVGYIAGSALLYTLNHIWRFDWGLSEQVRLFCLGLAYGAAAWRWRTLWGAVALHWGWNFANVLTDLAVPLDAGGVVAARMTSAAVHLAMLAVVLALPARKSES